nr:MAG TPA: hypothetical protein [Caudoviricetes sp.]
MYIYSRFLDTCPRNRDTFIHFRVYFYYFFLVLTLLLTSGVFTIRLRGVSTLYRGHARASGVVYDPPHRPISPPPALLYVVVEG